MIVNHHLKENSIIVLTFVLAMICSIVPLPNWALVIRPQWMFIVLLFWLLYAPDKVGPGIAWFLGCYIDLLMGTVLGEHAFLFVMSAYVVQRFLRVVQAMPMWQQVLGVMLMTVLAKCVSCLFLQCPSAMDLPLLLLGPALTNVLIWLWLSLMFRDVALPHTISQRR